MENEPNFAEYTYDDLIHALKHIDKEKYPDRYQTVVKLLNEPSRIATGKFEGSEGPANEKYSTFWPRFGAALIDGILFSFLLYLECLILGVDYDTQDKFLQALNGVQFAIYAILMHGYFGQTVGKMVLNVKVLDHETEDKINIKQALRRESVNLVLNIAWVLIILVVAVTLQMSGALSVGLSYGVIGFGILSMIWGLSEFVTMLFNDKRRALHDYIGKTVVVRI